jgi:hypothetical protein
MEFARGSQELWMTQLGERYFKPLVATYLTLKTDAR